MEESLIESGKASGRRWDLSWNSKDGKQFREWKADGKAFQIEAKVGSQAWSGFRPVPL